MGTNAGCHELPACTGVVHIAEIRVSGAPVVGVFPPWLCATREFRYPYEGFMYPEKGKGTVREPISVRGSSPQGHHNTSYLVDGLLHHFDVSIVRLISFWVHAFELLNSCVDFLLLISPLSFN